MITILITNVLILIGILSLTGEVAYLVQKEKNKLKDNK